MLPPMKILKILLAVFVVLIVLPVLAVLGLGLTTPADHVASSTATYGTPAAEVWARIVDFERWPAWNSFMESVEAGPPRDGKPTWTFETSMGPMPIVVETVQEPTRMVTRIPADAELGYSGTWTYEIEVLASGTRVTLTEHGAVPNPMLRGVTALLMDPHEGLNGFLEDLGGLLGEEVVAEELEVDGAG